MARNFQQKLLAIMKQVCAFRVLLAHIQN